jgi:hypothetical protein
MIPDLQGQQSSYDDRSNKCSIRGVVGSYKSVMATHRNPIPRASAVGSGVIADEVLKMQNDASRVIGIFGEGMQRHWRTASAKDGSTNLGRKAINVLLIVLIWSTNVAAFCRQLSARQ